VLTEFTIFMSVGGSVPARGTTCNVLLYESSDGHLASICVFYNSSWRRLFCIQASTSGRSLVLGLLLLFMRLFFSTSQHNPSKGELQYGSANEGSHCEEKDKYIAPSWVTTGRRLSSTATMRSQAAWAGPAPMCFIILEAVAFAIKRRK
jgi:hypothetical protein